MTAQPNPLGEDRPAVSPIAPGQTRWNWLPLARRAWIVLALLLLAYFVASIPVYYQSSLTACTPTTPGQCYNALVTEGNVQALAQLRLSVSAYVGFIVAFDVAGSLLGWAIGVLIFGRASREWTGLFFSLLLVLISATAATSVLAGIAVTAQTPPLLEILVVLSSVLNVVQWAAIAALLVTFPTGRLTPRWSWVLILLFVAVNVLSGSPNQAVNLVAYIAWLPTFIGIAGVQIYRYRRVYDAVQRQQTKWFVFAVGVLISFILITLVPGVVAPGLVAADSWYQLLPNPITSATFAFLLLSVGIAILRYHLWDIDVLINRALVYGSLTTLLAALYFGLIVISQALVRILTGSLTQQPLVLVASTLAIAALFQPLRRRIQSTIDGRFYRRKYDAAQVVAAFSSTLRQEVDLDELREQLVAVVQETMQPTRVSLWLRPTDQHRSRSKVNQSTFDVERNLTPSAAAATPLHRVERGRA